MKNPAKTPFVFNSISELHRALGLPKPLHPLVSLVDYGDIKADTEDIAKGMVLNFYKISYKRNFKGKLKYGQTHYDFDEGGLSFISPGQLISAANEEADYGGYTLLIHPDFIAGFPLGKKIGDYGFFAYSVAEALYLSAKEKEIIIGVFKNMELELNSSIDHFSQEVLISQIELILSYSKRFYNRQFITRNSGSRELLTRFEAVLNEYFSTEQGLLKGLPAVQDLASRLHVSPHYLGDMLRTLTGRNTQQHIHAKLIERAKVLLSTTDQSVAEVAYQLGFEHPQSFNKLFKSKTNSSPIAFRHSLN